MWMIELETVHVLQNGDKKSLRLPAFVALPAEGARLRAVRLPEGAALFVKRHDFARAFGRLYPPGKYVEKNKARVLRILYSSIREIELSPGSLLLLPEYTELGPHAKVLCARISNGVELLVVCPLSLGVFARVLGDLTARLGEGCEEQTGGRA